MDDVYYTIAHPAQHESKVKGSRFIGECATADTAEAATVFLEGIRRREHAATHHCYAYAVGFAERVQFKYSDDGEPSGTAGRPIYDTIVGRQLSNAIVVVTRYFGGTKLGTGGLVRAYSDAAGGVLDAAGRTEHHHVVHFDVTVSFPLYDLLVKLTHHHEARQLKAEFTDRVRLLIEVRRSRAEVLRNDIIQLSGGRATIATVEEQPHA